MKLQISNFASKSLCHVPQPAVSFFQNLFLQSRIRDPRLRRQTLRSSASPSSPPTRPRWNSRCPSCSKRASGRPTTFFPENCCPYHRSCRRCTSGERYSPPLVQYSPTARSTRPLSHLRPDNFPLLPSPEIPKGIARSKPLPQLRARCPDRRNGHYITLVQGAPRLGFS